MHKKSYASAYDEAESGRPVSRIANFHHFAGLSQNYSPKKEKAALGVSMPGAARLVESPPKGGNLV